MCIKGCLHPRYITPCGSSASHVYLLGDRGGDSLQTLGGWVGREGGEALIAPIRIIRVCEV